MNIQMQSKNFSDSQGKRKYRTKALQSNNNFDPDSDSLICQECGSIIIKNSQLGESCCSECGLVTLEKEIDFSNNEVRIFNSEERKLRSRTGPPALPFISLVNSTLIRKKETNNYNLKRSFKLNTHQSLKIRNLRTGFSEILRIGNNIGLSSQVMNEAQLLFAKALKEKLLRGRGIVKIAVASLYIACRLTGTYKTFKDLIDRPNLKIKSIKRMVRLLIFTLNLKIESSQPSFFVSSFISELNLDPGLEAPTIELINEYMSGTRSSGKNTRGISAAALYTICLEKNMRKTQKEIAQVAQVTENTLRKRYREIIEIL